MRFLSTEAVISEQYKALDLSESIGGPAALCLSGGGIRSAAFCLSARQSSAREHLLHEFHYLSTVSGGGYIGGWLTRCMLDQGIFDNWGPRRAAKMQRRSGGGRDPQNGQLRRAVVGKRGQHAVRLRRERHQVFSGPPGPDALHPPHRPRELKDHRALLIFTGIYSRWVTAHLNLRI